MEPQLSPGIESLQALTVSPDDTAIAYGSGTLEVFATPAMIAMMEKTAMESVAPFLPEGSSSVGTLVNVSHLRACGIGSEVTLKSILTSVEGRKLDFEVFASDSKGVIGKGNHTRYNIDRQQFMQKL